jgi:hypothetical protein
LPQRVCFHFFLEINKTRKKREEDFGYYMLTPRG